MPAENAAASAAINFAADAIGTLPMPGGVRYVARLGSGLEEAFPRPATGKAPDSAAVPSTASSNACISDPCISADSRKYISSLSRGESSLEVGIGEWKAGPDDVETHDPRVGSATRTRVTTASTSTQAPDVKPSDWVRTRSRRSNKGRTPTGRAGSNRPTSISATTGVRPPPPAWEPEYLVSDGDAGGAEATEARSLEWSNEDEQDLRCRIRDTMAKIEGISGGLQKSGGKGEAGDGGNGGGQPGTAPGPGAPPVGRGRRKHNQAGVAAGQADGEGSIKDLYDSLQISMELVATGEKHASANATAIEDMSEWLSGLEQKQLINIRQDEGIQGTTMASVILAEGLAVGDCIREFSDQTTSAYKRLASIFKTASTESERAAKELVVRLADVAEEGEGGELGGGAEVDVAGSGGKEAVTGAAAGKAASQEVVIKAKKVERIKILQEKQLKEAAKNNEEAQAVINQLKTSLQQLENRFRQAESMNTTVTTNRHKDTVRWRTLALQYEMKISYLERALAQEESKLRIAEQVHREEGLELHLEMVSRQRGQTRDGTKSASMQEELAALCSKLSASNARVVIMENSKAKLEQELASEKEKYRLLKGQRAAQGKEALEEQEKELKSMAELHAKQTKEAERLHEEELAVSKRQLIELREANAEEAGRSEFEIKKLKGDLDIANQKSKARSAGGDERAATSQARMEALREEQEQIIAEAKYEKEAAQEVLEHTVQTFEMQLKEAAKLKAENGNLISELEKEVERLSARCKDLVEHREITSEERARIENALRQQHRLADEQRMKETSAHLADLEAEKQSLLSRVLEAEAETDRQRRAADDLVLVLEEAKTAQSALQAAAATQRAEASVRASRPEKRDDEAKAAERAARAKADDLERDLSKANKRVEDLERELTTAEQVAKDAADVKKRAKEEVERAALAEEQARAAVEEARAAAADGPNEHEQEMFRAEAILKAAVHELQGRLETTEDEVDLLHDELAGAQGSVDELEEEVEELLESRAKMRVEVHEAHCQIQRMTVERSSLRREGAEAADMLTNAEALLREVTGCIDRTEHEGTHSKVVETLSAMRRRKVDERAVKMNRARDRIEAENRARVEKALSAMRRLGRGSNSPGASGDDDHENIARRLESAPAHLRPILAVFLSPGFKKAFLAYAEQVSRGEVAFPSATGAVTKQVGTSLESSSPSATPSNDAPETIAAPTPAAAMAAEAGSLAGSSGSTGDASARGSPPPRRAISLDYPVTCPGHEAATPAAAAAAAAVPALARGAERRRQVAFGDALPSKSEASMMAAGKRRLSMGETGGRNGGTGDKRGEMGGGGSSGSDGRSQRRSSTRSRREQERRASGAGRAVKWHKHREGSDFSVTLTADTASGRAANRPSLGSGAGAVAGATESGATAAAVAAATAKAAAEAVAVRARQLRTQRKELKKREDGLRERSRLQEEIQREMERKSDEVEAEAAKIVQPGPEKDRLEEALRTAILELEAGAARMEELCRLSAETAAARQEAEQAYASATIEEAEAATVAEQAAAAAAAAAREVAVDKETGDTAVTPPAAAAAAAAAAADEDEAKPSNPETLPGDSRALLGETKDPPGTSATPDVAAGQEADRSDISEMKRPASNSAMSDPKRRRRSRVGTTTPRSANGGAVTPPGDANASTEDGGVLTASAAATAASGFLPHPVFARRERAVREMEDSAANGSVVLQMSRDLAALAEKLSTCEGKLAAATSAAATAATAIEKHESTPLDEVEITVDKATEELEMLADSKAEAVKKLAGTSLESMLAAMEMLAKTGAELHGDASNSIEDEAMKKQLRSNIASADIVEVSVALAEALILEREGSALLSRKPRARLDADQSLEKNRRGDPSMLPSASPASATSDRNGGSAATSHPASAAASRRGSTEGIDGIWSTQKAAVNERRLGLLSESLETSDIHDLQVLRRSLQRQADDSAPRPRSQESRSRKEGANRSRGGKARRSVGATATATATPSEVPAVDEDERWQADILGERLAAVTRAVEKKGGWRSAVFLDKSGSQVNVDVDVEPWPAAEGVLMLQTVKDALYVQLMETRSKVEELEDVAALVSGRDELETHLEAAADLHRAVALLWEGVGNVLDSAPEDKRASTAEATTSEPSVAATSRGLVPGTAGVPAERFAGAPDTDKAQGNSTIPTMEGSDAVLVIIRDEESRDTPMHLEGLPLPAVTNALSHDVGKIRASTKFLISGITDALRAAAAAGEEAAAAAASRRRGDAAGSRSSSPEASAPPPAAPVPAVASLPPAVVIPRTPSPLSVPSEPERTSPPESDREIISAPGSDQVASGEGEEEQRGAPSMTSSDGQGAPEAVGEEDRDPETGATGEADDPDLTARTETQEEEPVERVQPPPPTPEEMTPPVEGGATQEELDEAWERAREMEETARGLREVVEERGGVIGLLQREVEDLKAALADAEARMSDVPIVTPTPAVDPRLKQELQQAMSALGDERAFLADTTQKLDTSLQERERLLEDVAESKVKEQQLETLLQEVCGRELQLVAEIKRLQEVKAADGASLERLDAQIEEDPGLDEPALEDLRSKRRQKAKNVADTNGRLKVARSQHDDMWERAMNSYKWVHHLPQISVKNRTYKSIQEWIEAEIADQRKERKRLERAARLRFQKMEPRSLTYSRDQPPFSTGSLAPVVVTPLGLSSRSKTTTSGIGDARRGLGYGYGYGAGGDRAILGSSGSQRDLKVGNLMKGTLRGSDSGQEVPRHLQGARVSSKIQDERRTYESRSAFDFYRDNQHSQQSSSPSGGGPSSTPPALTVSIPSPPLEKESTLPRPTPTRGKSAAGLNSAGYDGALGPHNGGRAASFVARTPNEIAAAAAATTAEQQRYKSLFTNAPAELPAVTVLPAGGGDDRPSAGSASPPHRAVNAGEPVGKGVGSKNAATSSGGADVHQPTGYRRAQTAKIDYHNPVRRKSSNTSFTHPVGHPGGLNAAVQFRSQPDSLRAWGDGQADAASAETRGSPDALSRKRRVNTPVDGGGVATDREEPFRWIPGAHGDRRPIVHSRGATKSRKSASINENKAARDSSSTRGPTATPAGAAVAAHGAPGSASSASSGEAAATADRFAKAKATPSSGLTHGRGGWVDPRGSSLLSPTNTASSSGLPRQLAVPGSLIVAEEGAGVTGGGFANTAGGLPSSADRRRLRHSMSAASGGGRRQPGGATSGGTREAEVNNLHPAWRPKGLIRRQRATSVIRRG